MYIDDYYRHVYISHLPIDWSFRHKRIQHGWRQRLPHLQQQPVALFSRIIQKPFSVRVSMHLHELWNHAIIQVNFVHRIPLHNNRKYRNHDVFIKEASHLIGGFQLINVVVDRTMEKTDWNSKQSNSIYSFSKNVWKFEINFIGHITICRIRIFVIYGADYLKIQILNNYSIKVY